jgi:hypothetical protein
MLPTLKLSFRSSLKLTRNSLIININNRGFKKKEKAHWQTGLPTATVKWIKFAQQAGLPENPTHVPLKYFDTPVYHLPPSFHKAVFENSWHRQDVYSEPMDQETLKILDPVCK